MIIVLFGILLLQESGALCAAAPPKQASATNNAAIEFNPPHSVFTIPTKKDEGRDPFFPNATYLYPKAMPTAPSRPSFDASALFLQGIEPKKSVILGGKTFYAGDESDVRDSTGARVHIKCIEVKEDSAIVEVGGDRRELRLRTGVF